MTHINPNNNQQVVYKELPEGTVIKYYIVLARDVAEFRSKVENQLNKGFRFRGELQFKDGSFLQEMMKYDFPEVVKS